MIADNHGASPGVLSHRMFASESDATGDAYLNGKWVSHDDVQFGRHNTVQDEKPYVISFPVGSIYRRGNGGVSGVVGRLPAAAGGLRI